MCDTADVQAVLPFSPNPLKHVFCDILDGIVDASSQFRKRYNSQRFLRIFLTVDSGTCSSRLALDTDFLGLRMKLSRTLSMVSSVTLGLPARPFPWWQMQPLSRNCSYHLRIDDAGGPRRPNCHRNARWTATTVLLLANSSTHQPRPVGRAAILSNNDVCFSHEMALAALRPFQMYVHCVVFDTNFNIMTHFQLKIRSNEIVQ
jgi:hypothetical protein